MLYNFFLGTVKQQNLYQNSAEERYAFNPCVYSIAPTSDNKKIKENNRLLNLNLIKEREKCKDLKRQIDELQSILVIKDTLSKSKYDIYLNTISKFYEEQTKRETESKQKERLVSVKGKKENRR